MTTNDDDDNKDDTDLNDSITEDHLLSSGMAKPSKYVDEMIDLLAK